MTLIEKLTNIANAIRSGSVVLYLLITRREMRMVAG